MRTSLICSLFLLITLNLQAQDDSRVIQIDANGQVEIPADIILFNIQINAEAENPQEAFELHKQREQRLVELVKEMQIAEEDIRYQPISISRNSNFDRVSGEEKRVVQTNQSVTLVMRDFDQFEEMQVELIAADFNQFNARFSADQTEEARDEAIRKAVANARQKAEIIAGETGDRLGSVIRVHYGEPYVQQSYAMADRAAPPPGGMLQFDQTVTISVSLTVTFELGDPKE